MREALEAKSQIAVGYSLDPIRTLVPDFMNEVGELLARAPAPTRTPFSIIEKRLRSLCRTSEELGKNVEVARVLDRYFAQENPISRRLRIGTLTVGVGEFVRFWLPSYYVSEDGPVLTYFDPRGSGGLTPLGRSAVYAFMHHGIRVADPDFQEATLRILQVPRNDVGHRYKRTFDWAGESLVDFEDLNAQVRLTYRIWAEVQASKDQERPARSAPGQGRLF